MKSIKLNFSDMNVDFFSNLFLAPDHNSTSHNFMELFKVLNLWSLGEYHVYCPLDDDDTPMGICHGKAVDKVFLGHLYFMKEYRGKKALQGFEHCARMASFNLGIEKFVAYILPENKPAQRFVSMMGFEKVEEGKYVCDLKESA